MPAAKESWPVLARAPFTSGRKYSGASFEGHGNWLMGAADVLCTGDVVARAEEIGATGRRVLLLARCETGVDFTEATGDVEPAALLVLDQKLRPDAADTLAYFDSQGVAVKVISGDNAASVGAVARKLGMDGAIIDARVLPRATRPSPPP